MCVANVVQQMEVRESVQLSTLEDTEELWMSWKSSGAGKLTVFLIFLFGRVLLVTYLHT